MRLMLAAVVVLSTAGCASGAGAGRRAPRGALEPVSAPVVAAPRPQAGGPIDARTLASRNGLAFSDSGDGVLLQNANLRARFYPGSDRMTLDGQSVQMGQACVRDEGALMVPAAGARAVERAVGAARARRARPLPAPAPLAPLAPPTPLPDPIRAVAPATVGLGRVTVKPDPTWLVSVPEREWRWIVIHHSDDTSGCAAKYHRVHLQKGWEHGLGYHFVVGNGTMSGDGEVEVGDRWVHQLHGAHAKTEDNRFNDFGIGVVLVGDFEHGEAPTARQYDACVRLTRWLMARYRLSADAVLRHSDCKPTCCPGPGFPWARFLADVSGDL
jgi:hypothetical protein